MSEPKRNPLPGDVWRKDGLDHLIGAVWIDTAGRTHAAFGGVLKGHIPDFAKWAATAEVVSREEK